MVISLNQGVAPEHLAFWRFSGQIYTHPPVATALLEAQTRWQIWINDWLFALWQAQHRRILRPTFNQQLGQHHRWRQAVVIPWRINRQQAKTTAPHLYAQQLSAELALEWCDQLTLALRAQQLTQHAAKQSPSTSFTQSLCFLSASTPHAATRLQPILTKALLDGFSTTATPHKP